MSPCVCLYVCAYVCVSGFFPALRDRGGGHIS